MKERDKILICNGYDAILNCCPRIPTVNDAKFISARKIINNLKFKAQHDNVLYTIALDVNSKLLHSSSINDYIVYINEPDFKVRRYYPLDINYNGPVSIEQSLIVGEEEQQVIFDSKQKVRMLREFTKIPLIPISHVSKVQIADNMYYFKEEVIFVNEDQFEQLKYYVRDCISVETGLPIDYIVEDQRFKIRLWDVLNQRSDKKYFTIPAAYYNSVGEYDKEYLKHHDCSLKLNEWMGKHLIYYDNRGYYPATTKTMPLVKQLKKM